MAPHYTKTQKRGFLEKLLKGEKLPPGHRSIAEEFLGTAEGKEYASTSGSGDDSWGSVPSPEAGGKEDGKKEGQGSGDSSIPRADSASPDASSAAHTANTPGDLNPESVVSGILDGTPPPTKDRPSVVIPPKEEKRGRPKSTPGASRVGPTGESAKIRACRIAGYQTADMLVLSGVTFFGPEWNYQNPVTSADKKVTFDERQYLREAYAEMFIAYGWDKMPPWVGAVAATGSYVLVRVKMPETKKKLEGFAPKARDWFKKFFKKKDAPPTGQEKTE